MTETPPRTGTSRRGLLAGLGAAGLAAGSGAGIAAGQTVPGQRPAAPFFGPHQAGITTVPLPYLSLAGFDVVAPGRAGLADALRTWTRTAADLVGDGRDLTITFGFGPALFADRRFRLDAHRPAALTPLPAFPRESLDPRAGDGDLCVQACASTPGAAHHAVRTLLNATRPALALRWRQTGFRPEDGTGHPRGLFGFHDGVANLDVQDPATTAAHVWAGDGPAWMRGGSYLVVRRIRLLLDTWDRVGAGEQERAVGRRLTGERIAGAPGSHTTLAGPAANGGVRLLRRSYSYDAGVDPNGLLDSGLIFLCFQRDPGRQWVPVQRRLAAHDPLNAYSQHVASALFACPPGAAAGSWVGAELFA